MQMAKSQKIRLGILFGGKSGEHDVSLASAATLIDAVDPREFEITAIGITKAGKLASASEVKGMLPARLQKRVSHHGALSSRKSSMRISSSLPVKGNSSQAAPEIIFPLLHGPYGEDGTIQGLLETAGIPYVGCGVLASAVGMDKDVMKRLFLQAGLPVCPFLVIDARDLKTRLDSLRKVTKKEFGYPVFSKPANLGSSIGIRKISAEKEFDEAVLYSAQFDSKVVIEKGIDARELECAVLGNRDPEASIVGEIIPTREFYDYEAKYRDPTSRTEIPAAITVEQSEEVRRLSLLAFRAIGGTGLARVDFFLERPTGKIWLNEINTMPGFTPISMYAKLWAASGVSFQELVRRLVRLGFEQFEERARLRVFAND